MPALDSFFADVTQQVNAELDRLIPEQGQPPQKLRDAIRWSLLSGGKHFRPALVFAVGRAFECCDEKLVRTAAAIEMIHTYSLIHDDLPSMDDDELRRGRATCHKKFGEATAILAGDALQVLAFQVISEDERLSVETRIRLITVLARAAAKMVVGQQLDLDAEGKDLSTEEIEYIHRNKTGALICASAEAGAIIGGSYLWRKARAAFSDHRRSAGHHSDNRGTRQDCREGCCCRQGHLSCGDGYRRNAALRGAGARRRS